MEVERRLPMRRLFLSMRLPFGLRLGSPHCSSLADSQPMWPSAPYFVFRPQVGGSTLLDSLSASAASAALRVAMEDGSCAYGVAGKFFALGCLMPRMSILTVRAGASASLQFFPLE